MPDSPLDELYPQQLREKAEFLLKNGSSMLSRGHFLSAEALSVLFKLASTPDNSTDSLKILHEFQTHQIEMDLQMEQMEANERETSVELAHYRSLYECAPVGYVIISREGRIIESNRAGAALFGVENTGFNERSLEDLLTADSWLAINWQLGKLFKGSPSESCTVLKAANSESRPLHVKANLAPSGDVVLMTFSELERPGQV